jgi:hypothetical protein
LGRLRGADGSGDPPILATGLLRLASAAALAAPLASALALVTRLVGAAPPPQPLALLDWLRQGHPPDCSIR